MTCYTCAEGTKSVGRSTAWRYTLDVGFYASLPWHSYGSANVYYGSGFTNGDPNETYPGDYLPQHATVDAPIGKNFGERTTLSLTGVNIANTRVLIDNSVTFGTTIREKSMERFASGLTTKKAIAPSMTGLSNNDSCLRMHA